MKKALTFASLAVAVGLILYFFVQNRKAKPPDLYRLWDRFDAATKSGDKSALKEILTSERAWELDAPDTEEKLKLAMRLQPKNPRIVGVEVGKDQARLSIDADPEEGAKVSGTVVMIRENMVWKVDKVSWSVEMPPAPAVSQAEQSVASGSGIALLSPESAAVLDRMAAEDAATALAAWNELGVKYMNVSDFLKDYRAALYDTRAIHFTIFEESFAPPGGKPIRYFSGKVNAPQGPPLSPNLGDALRRHLWRLDDASGRGIPTFEEWWGQFEKARSLSRPAEIIVGREMPGGMNPFSIRDPGIPATGKANVTVDGKTTNFELATSFRSETRFQDPARAVLEYRQTDPKNHDTFLIVLSFDAKRTGDQTTGADAIKVEYRKNGQQYFPNSPCTIRVSSAYTSEASSRLVGSVATCNVHSAGIDHRVSVDFLAEGRLTKR